MPGVVNFPTRPNVKFPRVTNVIMQVPSLGLFGPYMQVVLRHRTAATRIAIFVLLISNLLLLRCYLAGMTTAQATQEEIRRGLSKFGLSSKSSKNLPEHAQDPTQPGNPDTKRTDQIFAEEVGRTSMLWNPFLNRGIALNIGYDWVALAYGARAYYTCLRMP